MLPLYERIEALCSERNLNITQMCKLTGVPRSALSDYKTGRKKSISLQNIEKIADYFEISVDRLLGKEEQKEKPTTNDGGRLSVEERVEQILDGMANENSGTLMLDGKPASPEALDALRQAIKMGVEYARKINSEKK